MHKYSWSHNDANYMQMVFFLKKEYLHRKCRWSSISFARCKHSFDEDEFTLRHPGWIMFMHVWELETFQINNWCTRSVGCFTMHIKTVESGVNSSVTDLFRQEKLAIASSSEKWSRLVCIQRPQWMCSRCADYTGIIQLFNWCVCYKHQDILFLS